MIQPVKSFLLCDTFAEIATIPVNRPAGLLYCIETRRWYRRTNGVWTVSPIGLNDWVDLVGTPPEGFSGGTVAWADVTSKPATFPPETHSHDYAATGHDHAGVYSPVAHNHTGTYEPANVNIQAHVASSHAPAAAQKNSDITKAEIEAKLTGVIASHSHSGGSDPWTYVSLGSDFSTTSNAAQNVTGLSFTPAANTLYVVEGMFLMRTATATVGPRPGCSWPTGLTDGVAQFMQTSSATANVIANGNISAAVLAPVGGLPNTTASFPATLWATFRAGASPSGNFQIQLASETNGTSVTMKAYSWIRYRSI